MKKISISNKTFNRTLLSMLAIGIWIVVLQNAGIIPRIKKQTIWVEGITDVRVKGSVDIGNTVDVRGYVNVDNEVDVEVSNIWPIDVRIAR